MYRLSRERNCIQRMVAIAAAAWLVACASTTEHEEAAPKPAAVVSKKDPFPSTYRPAPSEPTLIRGATVLIGNGERIDDGDVLIVNGRIEGVGQNVSAPAGARIIDAQGRWVTPGLIDVHSHLGVYPTPYVN